MKKALITGITGQDGSYLAELLLEKGYEVHGLARRIAMEDPGHRLWRIHHLRDSIKLHPTSLESFANIYKIVQSVKPDECYHLGAKSFVGSSFEGEFATLSANINGTHNMLAAIRDCAPRCHFYFAASSEMFGSITEVPQNEQTPFHPRSVYGISKVAGFHLTRNYREAHGINASCGILYNHESPRRGFEFVTRKITSHVAKIKFGLAKELRLGNLEAKRDWGHAREYVRAMWLTVQQDEPDDYVIATGVVHTVREFVEIAFTHVDMDYRDYVVVDPQFFRPAEVVALQGDASKAASKLGWTPDISFRNIVLEMVEEDLKVCRDGGTRLR